VNLGSEQGLYFQDRRFLSRYQLRLNGHRLRPLAARTPEHYHAVHLLSNPVGEALPAESFTIVRQRLVGQGLHDDVEIQSYLDEPIVLVVELRASADFWHIFQVRGHSQPTETVDEDAGCVTQRLEHGWGLRIL